MSRVGLISLDSMKMLEAWVSCCAVSQQSLDRRMLAAGPMFRSITPQCSFFSHEFYLAPFIICSPPSFLHFSYRSVEHTPSSIIVHDNYYPFNVHVQFLFFIRFVRRSQDVCRNYLEDKKTIAYQRRYNVAGAFFQSMIDYWPYSYIIYSV